MKKCLRDYYHDQFRADLASLLRGFPPPEARIVALGHDWTGGCTLLPRIEPKSRAPFLTCLYFTVLVDQAMHSHSLFEHRRFEELTQYPKFRVGLGHPAYLNPALILETPVRLNHVAETEIRRIVPEGMGLFVAEMQSFFRDHMPQVDVPTFFRNLLEDPEVGGGLIASAKFQPNPDSMPLRELLATELRRAIAAIA